MTRRARVLAFWVAALAALPVVAGCRGCREDEPPPQVGASTLAPIERKRLSVLDRRAARKIDPAKKLAVDATGVAQCGQDIDCFVLTAERCAPSVFDHDPTISFFGVVHRTSVRYTIVGESDGNCELQRKLEKLEVTLHPELVAALRSTGKTDADVAQLHADAQQRAIEQNPERQSCRIARDDLLEAVLDLADGRAPSLVWNHRCTTASEPTPEGAAPRSFAPSAATGAK
jgi:hypothetical protein